MQLSLYRGPGLIDHLVRRELFISKENYLDTGTPQSSSGIGLLFLAIIMSGFIFWFNMYRANKFQLTKTMTVAAITILVVSLAFSVIIAIWSKTLFTFTCILLLPSTVLSFAVFYGLWSRNDYQLYEPNTVDAN